MEKSSQFTERIKILKTMNICRFCLTEDVPLNGIYTKRNRTNLDHVPPLPLQIMSCISLETYKTDDFPDKICDPCMRRITETYTFKQNCKKAENALRNFLDTGTLVKPTFNNYSFTVINEDIEPSPPLKPVHHVTVETPCKDNPNESQTADRDESEIVIDHENVPPKDPLTIDSQSTEEDEDDDDIEINEGNKPTQQICFSCNICKTSFPVKKLLDAHMRKHGRHRNYTCGECDDIFPTKYDLGKHIMVHMSTKQYNCSICFKQFNREVLLRRHEKTHKDIPSFQCETCNRVFSAKSTLILHINREHRKSHPYECKICTKSFALKQNLERHEALHSARFHKCNYCEATFNSLIKLTRHVTSHSGLRPYPCDICGRTFLLSHHLTRHKRTHFSADKSAPTESSNSYKCDLCSMSFQRKDSLINHSVIHSMVNLKCVICNTEFESADMVKEHIATHLSDLPYSCELCDYSFETQEQLDEHEMKHAEMEYENQIEKEVLAEATKKRVRPSDSRITVSVFSDQEDVDDEEDDLIEDEEDEDDEDEDDNIAEYSITNVSDDPELVLKPRKSKRLNTNGTTIKEELDDDGDDGAVESYDMDAASPPEIIRQTSAPTKMYSGKKPTTSTNGEPTNHKQVFNMKIGNKTVVVQKMIVTKEQMQKMVREGNQVVKTGNTVVLRKGAVKNLPSTAVDAIMKNSTSGNINWKMPFRASQIDENIEQERGLFAHPK